jgi:hypothetical protein
MVRLTKQQMIAPYVWTLPDDEPSGGARVALGTSVGVIEAIVIWKNDGLRRL